ncbi:MAG: hypothetical protein KA763_00670, partial [Xanthomonadales bacterium]|nr:hypothetical protein [Xanthomonadales bacterium]
TALLDRAVLTKARAAVAHPEPVRHRPPRWIAFAASFAGVAIAAGIGWRVFEARQMPESTAAAKPATREEVFEVDVVSGDHRSRDKGLEMAQLPSAPPPPAPPPPPVPTEPQAFKDEALAKQALPQAAAEALAAPAPAEQKSGVPDPHQRADYGGAAAIPERRQNIAAPATAAAPAVTDALGGLSAEGGRLRSEGDEAIVGTDASSKRKADLRAPAPWLAHIRQLVRDGRHTEARTELHAFHLAYPDVVIPTDLRRYDP